MQPLNRRQESNSGILWPVRLVARFSSLLRFAPIAAAAVFATGGGYLAYDYSASEGRFGESLSKITWFKPEKLVLNGNYAVDSRLMEATIAQQAGQSLFAFDPEATRSSLLENPWFSSVSVRKVYPETIRVDVVEREPFAVWKSQDSVKLIARDGVVLGRVEAKHMHLPQVVGEYANLSASEFIVTIAGIATLSGRSKAFVRVAGRRWNIVLKNGVSVLLPENDWREALVELERLQTEREILDSGVGRIDMRLSDRLVLQLDENIANARRERFEKLVAGKRKSI